MFCQHCGNKLRDGARFCNRCGKPVTADCTTKEIIHSEPIPKSHRKHTDLNPAHSSSLHQNRDVRNGYSYGAAKKKKPVLGIMISAVSIMLIAVLAFVIYNNTRPLSYDEAYAELFDKYTGILKKESDYLISHNPENNHKNIAILNLQGAELPMMLYFAKGIEQGAFGGQEPEIEKVFSYYDSHSNPKVDSIYDVGISYGDEIPGMPYHKVNSMLFTIDDDMTVYEYSTAETSWGSVRELSVFSASMDNGNSSPIAYMLKHEDGTIDYYVAVESFYENGTSKGFYYDKPGSGEDYNAAVNPYFDSNVTIVLSDLDDTSDFKNIVGDISMTYDEAISFLKEKLYSNRLVL